MITNLLAEKCDSVHHIDKVLEAAASTYDVFPSLRQFEELIVDHRPIYYRPPVETKPWESERCPGIHPCLEMMCVHIENGTTEHRAFVFGTKYLEVCGIKADTLWSIYEAWTKGEMTQEAKDFSENTTWAEFTERFRSVMSAQKARRSPRLGPQTHQTGLFE